MHTPVVNENKLYVMGEHENINKDSGRMGIPPSEIKIDDEVVLRDTFSVGSLEANSKTSLTSTVFLEGDMEPNTIEVMFHEPTELENAAGEEQSIDSNDEAWKVIEFQKK